MEPQTVIVVGASAGGVDALGTIVSALPADFAAAILVVLHIGAHKSNLPWLLNRQGPIEAVHPADGDPVEGGRVYVAPPDHHLTVEDGVMRLTKGPRENFARPAIDPLFRSAAQVYGSNLIGVMLTGGLNDGTAGMYELKQHGGLAIVQDPEEALNAGMPRSVMAHMAVDHCVPVEEIAPLLVQLVSERSQTATAGQTTDTNINLQVPEMTAEFTQHRPIAVTCPDCGGALRRRDLGTITLFECHIGHRYTAEVMLAAQFLAL
uniref:chemotaxis protein CheB n=1 Tax=Phenylobacterium sp. TaxID=1871053 RepID=UPI0039830D29